MNLRMFVRLEGLRLMLDELEPVVAAPMGAWSHRERTEPKRSAREGGAPARYPAGEEPGEMKGDPGIACIQPSLSTMAPTTLLPPSLIPPPP